VLLEAGEDELVDAGDMVEDLACLPDPVPVVRGDMAVDEQRRAAMLDLLDEVPQEQRA
jgi:hypothetical protein